MNAIGRVVGWLGRKAVVFAALVAAMLTHVVWSSGDVQAAWERSQTANARRAAQLDAIVYRAAEKRKGLAEQLRQLGDQAQKRSVAELDVQIAEAKGQHAQLSADQPSQLDVLLDTARLDLDAIRKEQERLLMIAFLDRKIDGLQKAADAARNYDAALDDLAREAARIAESSATVRQSRRAYRAAARSCRSATAAVANFDRSWLRTTFDRLPLQHRRIDLVRDRNARCSEAVVALMKLRRALEEVDRLRQSRTDTRQNIQRARAWIDDELPRTYEVLAREAAKERESAKRTITAYASWTWVHYGIGRVLKGAAIVLVLVVVTPFIVRLFCYFVLAPLAMRSPSIRLRVPEGRGAVVTPSEPSTTSVVVRLGEGEELLVRQDYLQTTGEAGRKGTQWWLDWRKPITSIVTGLFLLSRVRGDGAQASISATRDGLAEVTILTVPEGASCVLQPRALAALVQPIRNSLRITSHWRLGSLNAWLTLQLRYLVFHGPVRLVLKGGRGVRVQAAEQGQILGQEQLVGFSTDLAYSVTRTEFFWLYFLGREQLLKDRVLAGKGVLIVEEAPGTVRDGNVHRGLEGIVDAGMKVFGL
jgi:hypothetical protein